MIPRRLRQRDRGAVAVEFALVLPLFLLLVLGGVDWGFYFYCSQAVGNGVREGARSGAVARGTAADPTQSCNDVVYGAIAVTKSYLKQASIINADNDGRLLAGGNFDADCSTDPKHSCCQPICVPAMTAPSAGACAGGTLGVEVRAVYQFRSAQDSMSLTGFLPGALLPRTVTTTSVMRLEP